MYLTPTTELLAAPRLSADHVSAFLNAQAQGVYDNETIDLIVNRYFVICQRGGVDPLLAIAQMLVDSEQHTSWMASLPHGSTKLPDHPAESGKQGSFAVWERAIPLHIGLLLAYALTDRQANGDQWTLIAAACSVVPVAEDDRGRGKTLSSLGELWSNEADYAERIAAQASTMVEWASGGAPAIVIERGMYDRPTQQTQPRSIVTDELTGLFNRVYMEVSLERDIHQALRHGNEIGLIILNLDDFRDFNETLGYSAGDTILRELGKFLFKSVRRGDIACRYGGDAFVLVMPDASLENTQRRAEEVRQTVKHLEVCHRGEILRCNTISAGVSVFPMHGTTPQELLRAAAEALYQAKAAGRDRVIIAETAMEEDME